MIHYLLLFQFAFLYCLSAVIGLVVYGSNFDASSGWSSGWLYLFPLIVLPTMHKWIYPFITRGFKSNWPTLLLAAGAIVGLLAYKPMHFTYWDEHSSSQAIAVSLLGVFSYLASVYAASRVAQWQGKHLVAGASALLIISLIWACALMFPMFPFLGVSLILAIAILWPVKNCTTVLQGKDAGKLPVLIRPGYLLFLLMLDLSLVVWDFQINSQWAMHIACAFFMAALSYYVLSNRLASSNRVWVYALVLVVIMNMIVGVVWPAWLLMLPHAAIDGLLLGVICRNLIISQSGEYQPREVSVASAAVVWGMVFGYLFYSNLDYVQWRLVFILPYFLFVFRVKSRLKSRHVNEK